MNWPFCVAPLSYTGHAAIAADIANFKAALAANGVSEGFMTSIGPASCARIGNHHYKSDDEFVFACAEAMREEYKAIVDAGLILQIDDPAIAENFDQINPEPTRRGVPQVHHAEGRGAEPRAARPAAGPHPLPSLLGQLARPAHHRHRHARHRRRRCSGSTPAPIPSRPATCATSTNGAVWQDTKLPDDKLILPGVVSHATNVVEHPELVAERIGRFARLVGRERVIASTDCGLGGRVHPRHRLGQARVPGPGRGAREQAIVEIGLPSREAQEACRGKESGQPSPQPEVIWPTSIRWDASDGD